MTTQTNHDKTKTYICGELEMVLKAALSAQYTEKDGVPSEITQNIFNVIEAMFIHGLRDPFFIKGSRYAKYPEPNIWPFVWKFSEKSITDEVKSLKQIRSEIGRGRAWIRIVINRSNLEHSLQLLIRETKAISQFYDQYAFLRDVQQMEKISGFLKTLDKLPIHAAINSSLLNTWTPSPLILAGLVSGKPLKVGVLIPRRRAMSLQHNMEEDGRPDFLNTEGTSNLLASVHGNGNSSKNAVLSDDDGSSTYSHPSMLGSMDKIPEQVILSSTPLPDVAVTLPPQKVASLIVSRRIKRSRRRRSGSEGNLGKAHSQSEYASTPTDTLAEMDTSAICGSHPHMSMSETLDSGFNSENRYPNAEFVNSASHNDEAGLLSTDEKTIKISEETLPHNEEQPDSLVTPLTGLHAEEKCELSSPAEDDVKTAAPVAENEEVFDQLPDIVHADDGESCNGDVVVQTPKLHDQEDSVLGTSPYDETFLAEVPPNSNSLLNRSWTAPRRCMSNPERCSSARLSSSSSTDFEVGIVNFDKALCSAMEGGDSSKKMKGNFVDLQENTTGTHMESRGDEEKPKRKNQSVVDPEKVIAIMTTIPLEIGLDAQEFHCPMCRKLIGAAFSKYGNCGIDGLYYCSDCMNAGGEVAIPSRILRSWDWKPRPVSDRGRAFYEANQDTVVFHIDQQNPILYDQVPALKTVKSLREKLQIASMYLFTCRESIAEDFQKRLWPRNHLYMDIHAYSMTDMILLRSGLLEKQLIGFLRHTIDHIMRCFLCRQKGFICEVCEARDAIYPFETETTFRCSHCSSVFHSACVNKIEDCPRCLRRATYEIQQEPNDLPLG